MAAIKKSKKAVSRKAVGKRITKKTAKKAVKKGPAKGKATRASAISRKKNKIGRKSASNKSSQVKVSKKNSEQRSRELLSVEPLTHGDDLHLIPVTGEINPQQKQDSKQHEKIFRQREEVQLNQENMKAKQALATRKNIKTNFRNLRQP
jgi:hypothetical protein